MDMDHSMSDSSSTSEAACKISMLWNWYTVDACFISEHWQIKSGGGYAGMLIAIFVLVVLVEGVRRMGREYDRRIVAHQRAMILNSNSSVDKLNGSGTIEIKPTLVQQAVRSLFHTVQFAAGYMMMLLAMYYNGGIIFTIFVGAYVGHFLTARDTLGHADNPHKEACCGA
ncbi:Copper Transporter integral membrane protein that functions in high affinity copper transport [Marasmius crinis-equi]|uniref:Copper transport protein n=1 Tax=Marasmius crinis-equi TaxID=585013 RepID=A0ABR3F696_9AGAR